MSAGVRWLDGSKESNSSAWNKEGDRERGETAKQRKRDDLYLLQLIMCMLFLSDAMLGPTAYLLMLFKMRVSLLEV